MKKTSPDAHLTVDEKNMLWDLHEAINEIDSNIGIGWRIVKQVDQYLMNLPIDDTSFSRGKALDAQIVQRVLTKVRGSEEQMNGLVGTFESEANYSKGKLEAILDKYTSSSDFIESRKVIKRKAKELKLYGFIV